MSQRNSFEKKHEDLGTEIKAAQDKQEDRAQDTSKDNQQAKDKDTSITIQDSVEPQKGGREIRDWRITPSEEGVPLDVEHYQRPSRLSKAAERAKHGGQVILSVSDRVIAAFALGEVALALSPVVPEPYRTMTTTAMIAFNDKTRQATTMVVTEELDDVRDYLRDFSGHRNALIGALKEAGQFAVPFIVTVAMGYGMGQVMSHYGAEIATANIPAFKPLAFIAQNPMLADAINGVSGFAMVSLGMKLWNRASPRPELDNDHPELNNWQIAGQYLIRGVVAISEAELVHVALMVYDQSAIAMNPYFPALAFGADLVSQGLQELAKEQKEENKGYAIIATDEHAKSSNAEAVQKFGKNMAITTLAIVAVCGVDYGWKKAREALGDKLPEEPSMLERGAAYSAMLATGWLVQGTLRNANHIVKGFTQCGSSMFAKGKDMVNAARSHMPHMPHISRPSRP